MRPISPSSSSEAPLTPIAPMMTSPDFREHAAVERDAVRDAEQRQAALALDDILERLGLPAEEHGRAGLQRRDLDTADLRVVVAVKQHQMAAFIDDRDDELNLLRLRGGFRGRGNGLRRGDGQAGSDNEKVGGAHRIFHMSSWSAVSTS